MHNLISQLDDLFRSSPQADDRSRVANILAPHLSSITPDWHPLGFIHALLTQKSSGETFRLHIWGSNEAHPLEQSDKVHDHRFDIESRVIVGAVENRKYQFCSNDAGELQVRRVHYGDGETRILQTDEFGEVEVVSSEVITAPGCYIVHKNELHETRLASAGLAMTVVRTSAPRVYSPRVIFERDAPPSANRSPIQLTPSHWQALKSELFAL